MMSHLYRPFRMFVMVSHLYRSIRMFVMVSHPYRSIRMFVMVSHPYRSVRMFVMVSHSYRPVRMFVMVSHPYRSVRMFVMVSHPCYIPIPQCHGLCRRATWCGQHGVWTGRSCWGLFGSPPQSTPHLFHGWNSYRHQDPHGCFEFLQEIIFGGERESNSNFFIVAAIGLL